MLIKDICKQELIVSSIYDSIKDVSKKMQLHDIGFMPIKDQNQIIGVITDRDIVIRALAENKTELKDVISSNIVSIDINQDVNEALNYYRKYQIKRLLVTNNNEFVGVLSLADVLKSNDDKLLLETFKSIYKTDSNDNHVSVESFEL